MDDTLNRIELLLKSHKMSKISLLSELGLSKSAWGSWARGETTTYMDHIPKIAEIFDVSSDYILGIEQKNKPAAKSDELNEFLKDPEMADIYKLLTQLSPDGIQKVREYARFQHEQENKQNP